MNEQVNKDELSLGIFREILKGNGTSNGGVFYDMTRVDEKLFQTKYKDYYMRYKTCGIDIKKEYAEIAPAPHTTLGGIVVDERCWATVSGLFACGEVMGGLHGANRLGGNAGLETLIFGKIAGESAAEYASGVKLRNYSADEEIEDNEILIDPKFRNELEELLNSSLNVIRCEEDMKNLLSYSKTIIEKFENNKSYSARRLYNDAYTACLAVTSAIERKESIGCHIRSDDASCDGHYRIILKNDNGKILVKKEQI